MDAGDEPLRVAWLRDLGTMDVVPVGTRMHVEEDGFIYTGVGQTTPEIIGHIGWKLANIWMPDHVETGILLKHGVFPDPVVAAQVIWTEPLSVHHDRRGQGFIYFLIAAGRLREAGLLTSRSTDFVDGVVESRHVSGGYLLRFFHLAPVDRNKGGQQLWPYQQN